MLRALPFLIVVGFSVYAFIDVLRTPPEAVRRGRRGMWIILTLVPAFGAALWFLLGRPARSPRESTPGRGVSLRSKSGQRAPDDDVAFLRRLDEEVWIEKRKQARAAGKQPGAGKPPVAGGQASADEQADGGARDEDKQPADGPDDVSGEAKPGDDQARETGETGPAPDERPKGDSGD